MAVLLALLPCPAFCAAFKIISYDPAGQIGWTNAFPSGVCTVETTPASQGVGPLSWTAQSNFFTTNSTGLGFFAPVPGNTLFRLLAVDISTNTAQGYTNLLYAYGLLRTIAGTGLGGTDGTNYWDPDFEGDFATNVSLSRPHFAMADKIGNVFIVDRDSDSVLKIDAEGRIHTVAGTHTPGFNGDGPGPATSLVLSQPNGLYVKPNGSFFILDTGNNRVRQVETNGVMSTLFVMPAGISPGRGLWVADSGREALFCAKTVLQAWDSTNGVFALNNNFIELGNIYVPAPDYVLVTDRGANRVYKVVTHGSKLGQRTLLYGDGNTHAVVDGSSALTSSLNGVRGIWPLPTGGYLLALHEGAQILYVDPTDRVYVFLDGQNGQHAGDDTWFHSPGPKIAQARSVTMDYSGNILIVENDFGYIRQIDFHRLTP